MKKVIIISFEEYNDPFSNIIKNMSKILSTKHLSQALQKHMPTITALRGQREVVEGAGIKVLHSKFKALLGYVVGVEAHACNSSTATSLKPS